jgi:hypothetical protein
MKSKLVSRHLPINGLYYFGRVQLFKLTALCPWRCVVDYNREMGENFQQIRRERIKR